MGWGGEGLGVGRGRRKWERQWRKSIGEERALESVMEAEGIVWEGG